MSKVINRLIAEHFFNNDTGEYFTDDDGCQQMKLPQYSTKDEDALKVLQKLEAYKLWYCYGNWYLQSPGQSKSGQPPFRGSTLAEAVTKAALDHIKFMKELEKKRSKIGENK